MVRFRNTGVGAAHGVRTETRTGTGPAFRTITRTDSAAPSSAAPEERAGASDASLASSARPDAPLVGSAHRLDDRPRMSSYWPWWAGAIGLALVTINYTLTTDRSLGVSSAWDRVLHWRAQRRIERLNAQFSDERALANALAAATAEQFGTRPGAHSLPDAPPDDAQTFGHDAQSPAAQSPAEESASPRPAPVVTQAALLLSILLGGWVAAITAGRFELRLDMGDGFRDIVTANPITMIIVLFAGGVLVGFGTRLAGGCSSGHGLSGCGRLRPVSLVATAVFFGAAVVVSFLLWKVI